MIKKSTQTKLGIITLLSILLIVVVFFVSRGLVRVTTGGYDLLTHWKGTLLLLKDNQDPYLSTTTDQINRFLETVGKDDSRLLYRFDKPLFSLFFYAPLLAINEVEGVRTIWMTFNTLMLAGIGTLLYHLFKLRYPIWVLIGFAVFLLSSFPSFSTNLSGSLSIASLLFLILSIKAITKSNFEAAGFFLAFSLIEPKFSIILVLCILIWSLTNQIYRLAGWLLVTLFFLVGFSMLLLPIWPLHYVVSFVDGGFFEASLSTNGTNLQIINRLLLAKDAFFIVLLVMEWFVIKSRDNLRVLWLFVLTLTVSILLLNKFYEERAVALIPAIIFSAQIFSKRFPTKKHSFIMLLLSLIFVFSWMFSGALIPGIPVFSNALSTTLLAIISLIFLYWVRWWIKTPITKLTNEG